MIIYGFDEVENFAGSEENWFSEVLFPGIVKTRDY